MRIDLHCHTKKTKSGDPETRNVTAREFAEVLSDNGVGIVSCTNHNYFSLEDYKEFLSECESKGILLWPGIELDVDVRGEQGHILFICNPKKVEEFSGKTKELLGEAEPDDFCKSIDDVLAYYSDLDLVIIAHNCMKDNGFSDRSCSIIKSLVIDKIPVMFEPSSLKTVGIMFAHGISGLIGSDVKDWKKYPINKVPELKTAVNGFDTFKLLIKKDPHTISTFLDQKKTFQVEITPFIDEGDNTPIRLSLKDDINIIYGGKGTGKTKIIDALKDYFESANGKAQVKYYAGKTTSSEYNDLIKRNPDSKYFQKFNIADKTKEINSIKKWNPSSIVTTDKFYKGFKERNVKSSFGKFGFSKTSISQLLLTNPYNKELENYQQVKKGIDEIRKANWSLFLSKEEIESIDFALRFLKDKAYNAFVKKFIGAKAQMVTKWTIETMKDIALAKTGNHSIPNSTGLLDLYGKQIELYKNSMSVLSSIETPHLTLIDKIGKLPKKGEIIVKTEIYLNPNESTGVSYAPGKPTASILKKSVTTLKNLKEKAFTKQAGCKVKEFNEIASTVSSLEDFVGIKSEQCRITEDGNIFQYKASSGEQSMLLLDNALIGNNAKIYLLDEPELSVGHKYINDVIVPRLIELSRMDKIIVVSTHDSNIAVRTLPFVSIYREDQKTYQGNLFTNVLVSEDGEKLKWIDTSIDCLEGGELAFEEREKSYGKI